MNDGMQKSPNQLNSRPSSEGERQLIHELNNLLHIALTHCESLSESPALNHLEPEKNRVLKIKGALNRMRESLDRRRR